jgi:Defence against restriction A C-terminal
MQMFKDSKSEMTQKHRYGLAMRPAGIGCVPKGNFTLEEPLAGCGQSYSRHGVIVYDRELLESELISFELVEIATQSGLCLLAKDVAMDMGEYAENYLEMAIEHPEEFKSKVCTRIKELRKYKVYISAQDEFISLVKQNLEMHLSFTQ